MSRLTIFIQYRILVLINEYNIRQIDPSHVLAVRYLEKIIVNLELFCHQMVHINTWSGFIVPHTLYHNKQFFSTVCHTLKSMLALNIVEGIGQYDSVNLSGSTQCV